MYHVSISLFQYDSENKYIVLITTETDSSAFTHLFSDQRTFFFCVPPIINDTNDTNARARPPAKFALQGTIVVGLKQPIRVNEKVL